VKFIIKKVGRCNLYFITPPYLLNLLISQLTTNIKFYPLRLDVKKVQFISIGLAQDALEAHQITMLICAG